MRMGNMSWEFASGGSNGFQVERLLLGKRMRQKLGNDLNSHHLMSLNCKGQCELKSKGWNQETGGEIGQFQ